MPADYAPNRLYKLSSEHLREKGYDVFWARSLQSKLEEAGFVNIQRRVYNVPVGGWARDKELRVLGLYWEQIVAGFFQAMAGKPFTQAGMNEAETKDLLNASLEAMQNKRIHAYIPIWFIWAQKPPVA
jgi:hypothetical protein